MGQKRNLFKNATKLDVFLSPPSTVSENNETTTGHKTYDVCIIGAGPQGLAVLSAHCSPTSMVPAASSTATGQNKPSSSTSPRGDKNRLSVCVVDPSGGWLHDWNSRFSALDITWLRSPVVAHPDVYDGEALLRYAETHGRLKEIRQLDLTCSCLKGQPEAEDPNVQVGMYDLPSASLFRDFCQDLAAALPHDFVAARVESIRKLPEGGYSLGMGGAHPAVQARKVVCALGFAGQPNIPSHFQHPQGCCDGPERCIYHTSHCTKLDQISEEDNVVVVGGGLSAAQAALLAVTRGAKKTVLCSRRRLTTRQFDIPLPWVTVRQGQKLRCRFYCVEEHDKLDWIRNVRGGGSIPKEYMDQLEAAQAGGKLELLVDDVEGLQSGADDEYSPAEANTNATMLVKTRSHGPIDATRLILATGSKIDCMSIPLCKQLVEEFGLPVQSGLPVLSNDLQWAEEDIYVVGALAMLQLGPDAANLMGARRAAQWCAWLPEVQRIAPSGSCRVEPRARYKVDKHRGFRAPIRSSRRL